MFLQIEVPVYDAIIDCIAQAISDQDVFLYETEVHRVFSESVNECHKWLTSCPCHDHIWCPAESSSHFKQQLFEKETGCRCCWRRSRRGSELARGHFVPVIKKALCANSTRFQQLLNKVPREKQVHIVHSLERRKRTFVEELVDKLGNWQVLPWLVLGLWPADSESQGVASECVKQWEDMKARDLSKTANRVTKKYLDDSQPDNILAEQIRRLDETGEAGVALMLASKQHNMIMTHCQRVEEIHAGFQRRSQGSPCGRYPP